MDGRIMGDIERIGTNSTREQILALLVAALETPEGLGAMASILGGISLAGTPEIEEVRYRLFKDSPESAVPAEDSPERPIYSAIIEYFPNMPVRAAAGLSKSIVDNQNQLED